MRVVCLLIIALTVVYLEPATADEVVNQDFGYSDWVTPGPGDTVYDASSARWRFKNSDAEDPTKETEGCSGDDINRYPVGVRNYADLVLKRPLVEGEVSLTATWGHIYDSGGCNGTAVYIKDAPRAVIDGARVFRVWDAIRAASRNNQFYTIRNSWVSNARDDCVEADGSPPGLIEDSLFDGCFQGISMREGAKSGDTDRSANILTLDGVLFKILAHNHSEAGGDDPRFASGQVFKIDSNAASVVINNSIFAWDSPDMEGVDSNTSRMMGDSSYGGDYGSKLVSCSNNKVLWMYDDNPPSVLTKLDPCFSLLTGTEARREWESARCAWINSHSSEVTRRGPDDSAVCGSAAVPNPPSLMVGG